MALPTASGSAAPSLPPLNIGQTEKQSEEQSATPVARKPTPADNTNPKRMSQHRFLTPTEWARLAHGLGAVKDGEDHALVQPTCWYFPPKGMPTGLYRDIVFQKTKNLYHYHLISILRWALLVLQIMIGAVLTALGALSMTTKFPITILAAINTVAAGVLALLHNSGVPERLLNNKHEYSNVEDYVKELLDTAIVENDMTVDEAISHCFDRYQAVKQTVQANQPESYMPSSSVVPAKRTSGTVSRVGTHPIH